MTTSQCYLKFQSFNVEGISNQLKNDVFLSSIKKFDFISLVETWLPERSNINIEGYYCFNKCRRKARKARRYSGGICILVKKTLRKGVQFFSSNSDRFVWWKLDKQFFNMEEDIYVCSVYIPPSNSKHFGQSSIDPYSELQSNLIKYSKLGKVMLMGDFNSRKGQLSESIDENDMSASQFIDGSDTFELRTGYHIPHSHSMDKTVNKYGRSLINLCASNNLCILNGRIQGDRFGKFTCHKSNGASVVDYAILSNTLLRKVVYFSVLPLSFLSCHCPISFAIKTNKFFLDTNKSYKFLESKASTFIWERVKKEHYSLLLNNIETIKEANSYIDDIFRNQFSSESINNATESITRVICKNAAKCFKIKRRTRKKTKSNSNVSRNKKWFDKDCEKAKKELTAALKNLNRYPKDPIVRGKYHKMKKEYKQLIKKTEHKFKEEMLQKISQLE